MAPKNSIAVCPRSSDSPESMPGTRNIARAVICASLALIGAACGVATTIARSRSAASPKSEHQVGFPAALYAQSIPPDNPQTPAKIALGQALFVEQRLSADNLQHCEGCHNYALGFTDQKKTSVGIDNQSGRRNAPTILNAMFNSSQFWDGRAATLEEQAKSPILNPIEMGMKSPDEVVAKLKAIPRYREAFERVFGREVNFDDLARALASYERTQISFDSPFDHYVAGERDAIGESAKRGWRLFNGNGRCIECHAFSPERPLFSDGRFHNVGLPADTALVRDATAMRSDRGDSAQLDKLATDSGMSDLGRYLVTRKASDIGAFRTPDLRNLLVTEPYFHDGSAATLWEVIAHFNRGGVRNPYLDSKMAPLGLSGKDQDDLVAFLATLTSPEYASAAKVEYERQYRLSHDAAGAR
jgi:cytochrome c peroxidase